MISFCDLKSLYLAQKEELDTAFRRVMESGWYILGKETASFEKEFAEWCGVPFCVAVASGTDAVELALRVVGVEAGDHVATVSHTAVATVAAIERIGAIPVLADVENDRYTMDPSSLKRILQKYDLKAIVPVHLYGQCADLDNILPLAQKYGCKVVEDCAQAHGALLHNKKAGTFGDAGAFSFYPTKNLGTFGDGGAIVVPTREAAEHVRSVRQYGWHTRYISSEQGCNSRLDEIQAAFLRVRLQHLDQDNLLRQKKAQYYFNQLSDLPGIILPKMAHDCRHVWHLFVIQTEHRDELASTLHQKGIPTAIHYPLPIHMQPAYTGRIEIDPAGLPNTEFLYKRILSLPMYPYLPDAESELICKGIRDILTH